MGESTGQGILKFGKSATAVHYYARNIAHAAASEALRVGSTTTGSTSSAVEAAHGFIDTAGDGFLIEPTIAVDRTGATLAVTVTCRSLPILTMVPTPTIHAVVSGAIETTP